MKPQMYVYLPLVFLLLGSRSVPAVAETASEEESPYSSDVEETAPPEPSPLPSEVPKPKKATQKRKYFIPDTERLDAGAFHVGFAAGGNFYLEPKVNAQKAPTGEYAKDFGFQGGAYFDYDYSALTENVPLGLRGMLGYKYILSSVHVFTFDGMVRYMFRMSEKSTLGVGIGGSAAIWYRVGNRDATKGPITEEEVIFLPSFVAGAGFEFNPFMVDFKWLINRFGQDSTITGFELYFGFRL